jgi:hypothetical protein
VTFEAALPQKKDPTQIFGIDAREIQTSELEVCVCLDSLLKEMRTIGTVLLFAGVLSTPTISAAQVAIGDLARKAALFSLPDSHWDICLWRPFSKFDALFGEHDSGGAQFIH